MSFCLFSCHIILQLLQIFCCLPIKLWNTHLYNILMMLPLHFLLQTQWIRNLCIMSDGQRLFRPILLTLFFNLDRSFSWNFGNSDEWKVFLDQQNVFEWCKFSDEYLILFSDHSKSQYICIWREVVINVSMLSEIVFLSFEKKKQKNKRYINIFCARNLKINWYDEKIWKDWKFHVQICGTHVSCVIIYGDFINIIQTY